MIYYFLVSTFVLGTFVGSSIDSEEKPTRLQWFFLGLFAIFWPFTAFIYAKDWLEGRK